ncbi:putative ABC-type transport system, periplasmic component/surface lipoprotein [Sphaerochaeta pleomorpha str. Grapes]|uniref:Putative ABC-type transport system, periplasmic component/surface lipoprotein n=1 Tax=Sphaerochaeta pleomorpha (strain ATCC BAA-1885 / DSM 22778 / Grapes) TaxID=158190 RepID=G8QSI3_SPHPG|nr:BMP family protein [Sphaerochaeta pleomorpha]AEV27882.1 putative ABC-type transport system, periplasmic component/surface lipoprotein [Sphaerochaeta pleomorpha str. Grapes]
MKKTALVMFLILVVACTGLFAGGSTEKKDENSALKVALLLSGPANDQGWNAVAFAGLKAAEEAYKIETAYSENVGIADGEAAFTDYASQGYDLVIGHGFQFGDPAVRVSANFPKTKFMAIESNVFSDNAASYVMACEQAGYLMGMLSASMSKTGIIGMVGGFEQPSIVKVVEAYKLGAKAVNPSVKVLEVYISSFTDVSLGKEAALSMADQGADVLSHIANQAGTGVIKAAEERGLLATGDSYDQNSIAPNTVMASTIYSVPALVLSAVEKVSTKTYVGGVFNLGMKDGVVDISGYNSFESKIPATTKQLISDTRLRILDGSFSVPLIETRTK